MSPLYPSIQKIEPARLALHNILVYTYMSMSVGTPCPHPVGQKLGTMYGVYGLWSKEPVSPMHDGRPISLCPVEGVVRHRRTEIKETRLAKGPGGDVQWALALQAPLNHTRYVMYYVVITEYIHT
jgi:hypothetical protein